MTTQTALLDVRRTTQADRLTVAAGRSAIALMEHAGTAVAATLRLRWTARPTIGAARMAARAVARAGAGLTTIVLDRPRRRHR